MTITSDIRRAAATLTVLLLAGCATGGPGDGGTDEQVDESAERRVSGPPASRFTQPDDVDAALAEGSTVAVENGGTLCAFEAESAPLAFFTDEDATTSVEAGDQLTFSVSLPGCLSSSCDVNRVAVCEVAVQGDTITVRSYLGYDELESSWCTMDCGVLTATCTTPPLSAGTYEVVHGDHAQELAVPSTFSTCAPADECVTDDDCDGWCGVDETGRAQCKAYAQEGANCGMYSPVAYQTQCDPSLICVGDPKYVDLGGFCRQPCIADAQCKGSTTCLPYPGLQAEGYCGSE